MKWMLALLLFFGFLSADEPQTQEHELYLTLYLHSLHFSDNTETSEAFNETHKAYGAEYIYQEQYSLGYNHFINSRGKGTDVYGAGYLLHFNDVFGLQLTGGYQEGYCFNGFLNSVECTQGMNNKSAFLLPLVYYKHKYFKVDLFTNSDMVALRFNLKVYDLFERD